MITTNYRGSQLVLLDRQANDKHDGWPAHCRYLILDKDTDLVERGLCGNDLPKLYAAIEQTIDSRRDGWR